MSTPSAFVPHTAKGARPHKFIQFQVSGGGYMRIEPVAPHTFRVRLSESDAFPEPPLVRYGVITHRDGETDYEADYETDRDRQRLTIRTAGAMLDIDTGSGTVCLRKPDGTMLTASSVPPWSTRSGFGAEFVLSEDERFYGLGDVTRDRIEQRGHRFDMWVLNVKSYAPIPYLMSSKGWGLFVNTTSRHSVDIGKTVADKLRFWGRSGELDFYLIAADSYAGLLDHYTNLTGKPQLLPIWAYGLTFVCNQQATAREMLDDAVQFRREGIPCDLIGLEPGWMEHRYDYSLNKSWHPERFYLPDWANQGPGTFIGALERQGFKLSLWLCCDYDLTHHEERLAGGTDEAGPADTGPADLHPDDYEQDTRLQEPTYMDKITKPEEPWFAHLQKFVDQGVAAFKMDAANQTLEHPDRKWGNGLDDNAMHNLYPLLLGKQMHTGFKEQTGRRSMIYSAGGYAGIQRYAATWAGDTGGGPRPLVSVLNHGLSGHTNTSCDMEVFTPAGIHFGFLQPWSQVNSWAYWRHPWLLDKKQLQMFKLYAKLRYRLLPYIYSAAHTAARTGLPIVRAMPLAYPDDPNCANLLQQYLFGDSLLVGAFTETIYLPAGEWIDYWTGARHTGGQELQVSVPGHAGGPLFIRAGAILPEWPEMDYVGEVSLERIGLRVYPYGDSEFTLYEDDGATYRYLEEQVAVTRIRSQHAGGRTVIGIGPREGRYEGMPDTRTFELFVHVSTKPAQVTVNDQPWQEEPKRTSGEEQSAESPATAWTYDDEAAAVRLLVTEDPARLAGVTVELLQK
ncbi:MAG: hypothetical protein K0Q94_4126 [Paenibacillus sp.]|jgi:alpha-glucosidase (family GH31 glycosyl hydrolase)|nr:hypothetical protein [Paenibacillus sp.]